MMRFTAQSGYLTALMLFILDENVFEQCTNLFGVVKLILLKISVGAIVVQGLIESFLYTSGTSPFKDDDTYDSEEKTLRAYCKFCSAHKSLCAPRIGFVWNRLRSAFLPRPFHFLPRGVTSLHWFLLRYRLAGAGRIRAHVLRVLLCVWLEGKELPCSDRSAYAHAATVLRRLRRDLETVTLLSAHIHTTASGSQRGCLASLCDAGDHQ
jgi:hypothetical protein